jgi:hypothetical protein
MKNKLKKFLYVQDECQPLSSKNCEGAYEDSEHKCLMIILYVQGVREPSECMTA